MPESLVIFTVIMELVLRDFIKSWNIRPDDFVVAAICYADDVVLVAASVAAAAVMGGRGNCKTEESGSVSWKTMDKSIVVDGLAVLSEEVLEFVGSKKCLDGTARCALAHRFAPANLCLATRSQESCA